jgi:hypothetical protein
MPIKKITTGNPKIKNSEKINRSIKSIAAYKKKEKKFIDTLDYKTYLFENPSLKKNTASFLRIRKNILKQSELVFKDRHGRLQRYFKLKNPADISKIMIEKYPHVVSVGLPDAVFTKYKKFLQFSEISGLSPKHSISFRYRLESVDGKPKVHLFEKRNDFGLNTTNPIYKEFYNHAVNHLKKDPDLKNAQFILDSKILDKR